MTSFRRSVHWVGATVVIGVAGSLGAAYVVTAGGGSAPPAASPTVAASADPSPAAITRKEGSRRVLRASSRTARLESVDRRARRAVISGGKKVGRGDVVASAPTRTAPHGTLFTVDRVVRRSGDKVVVTTKPATVADALGDTTVARRSAIPAGGISVRPLIPRLSKKITPARPTKIVKGDKNLESEIPRDARIPLTTLRLDAEVPLPAVVTRTRRTAKPSVGAWVEFTPELILLYKADGLLPSEAALGVGGQYRYGYKLHGSLSGALDTGRTPLKIPFADVDIRNTFWVGGIPLPVEAQLHYFYRLTADGRISIDAEQETQGLLTFGGRYTKAGGWKLIRGSKMRTTSEPLEITGAASATATIGMTGQVMLFDAVGAGAEFAPYLRGTAAAGAPPKWAVYAGLDLDSRLTAQLKIFGIKIWSHDWNLPRLHREWKLADQGGVTTRPVLIGR